MAQLMGATVAVFRESLTDSLKGFYKLRKAYVALESIVEAEKAYINGTMRQRASPKNLTFSVPGTPGRTSTSHDRLAKSAPSTPPKSLQADLMGKQTRVEPHDDDDSEGEDEVDDFYDAEEVSENNEAPSEYIGKTEINGVVNQPEAALSRQNTITQQSPLLERVASYFSTKASEVPSDLDIDKLDTQMDKFIHSGTNLCFGILLLLLSLIPPAFTKLLSIIGFRGDRQRGLRMLWQASRIQNAMGAMASLVILGYYNTLVAGSDIIIEPSSGADSVDDGVDGYPARRLEALLKLMKSRFPASKFWKLEEARMNAVERKLDISIKLLQEDFNSPLKQTKALALFERSLESMYIHDYELCASSFQQCLKLNNWSHALYLYAAGVAQVELYRQAKDQDPEKAKKYAEKAVSLFDESRSKIGKRRVMARQLPFDAFVSRKLSKWDARAKELNVPFIDAIGVSPLVEMTFFWNGFVKMSDPHLEKALKVLQWSEDEQVNPLWSQETLDEHAILYILRATVLRCLKRHDEAIQLLKKEILSHDKLQFKGGFKDDWTCPATHYEMAANLWAMRDKTPGWEGCESNKKLVFEAEEWLEKTSKWESYSLDARVGVKVTSGLDTIRIWKERHCQ